MSDTWTPDYCAACGKRECIDTTCCTDCTHRHQRAKDIDAMTQPLRSWVASRGYSYERTQAAIAALDDFVNILTWTKAASDD